MGKTFRGNNSSNTFVQGRDIEIRVFTLGGNDRITLNRTDDFGGNNLVDAGTGNDKVVNLHEGGNVVRLGNGNDQYAGSGFASFATERGDMVSGGAGHDTFAFETFKSVYNGDGGNDTFFSIGWQNTINGGAGTDTLSYQFRHTDSVAGDSGVVIDLFGGSVRTGASRTEFLTSIENAIGSIHADEIGGTNGANVLSGLAGNDDIAGFGGNDRLIGGLGADRLMGGAGTDIFLYNTVNESPAIAGQLDLILDFQRGIDKIDLGGLAAGNSRLSFSNGDSFSGKRGEIVFADGGVFLDRNGDGAADFAIDMNGLTTMSRSDFIF